MPRPDVSADTTFCIAAGHPCLDGHFPGNPIAPGVLILEEVIAAWNHDHAAEPVSGIANVKFLAPLRPDTPVAVQFLRVGEIVKFSCQVEARTIAQGRLLIVSRGAALD